MRNVHVIADAPVDVHTAFAAITRFQDFGNYADVIERVTVDGEAPNRTSSWTVNSRQGKLCWTEQDIVAAELRTIEYSLLDGDFEVFEGSWTIAAVGQIARITFTCSFDFGIPSMQRMLEPIAGRTLTSCIEAIITGALSGARIVDYQS